jgi:hypothetical protein
MTKVFFTYVWGPPGDPAWPLTFATKAARSHARKVLSEGDLVFTVCTQGVPTPPENWGQVAGVFQVSDLEVNTHDYDLPQKDRHPDFDSVTRFPYALHPLAVWAITSPDNLFAKLVGPLTPNHHLQAQSKIVELDPLTAEPLLALSRQAVTPALPKTEFGRGLVMRKNSKLAPKHEGAFTGAFGDHATWFVYTLVLRDAKKRPIAVKLGYSNAPEARAAAHNGPMASEVTGLIWVVDSQQPTSSEDAAREVEQAILQQYARHRLASNGEILTGVDPLLVAGAIATHMRSRAV